MKKALQYLSFEYLDSCRSMSLEQRLEFLENHRLLLSAEEGKRKAISIRIPERLLAQFKRASQLEGVSYQKKIVDLMRKEILKVKE